MIQDPIRVYDGFGLLQSGMDAGRSPELLAPTQYAYGENITCRGGRVRTRPPMRLLNLDVSGLPSDAARTEFLQGTPQGVGFYNASTGSAVILAIAGCVYAVNPASLRVTRLWDGTGRNPSAPQVWMCQAGEFFIIQDGSSAPVILDGGSARLANANEIPAGGPMAFGLGRLWVARGREFLAGDIQSAERGSVLKFTETEYLNEGGAFSLAAEMGDVTAMAFISVLDTATGQGPLMVFGEHGAASLYVNLPRAQWKTTMIQQVALMGIGAAGQRNIVHLNNDLVFRSPDGIRTFRSARAEQGIDGLLPFSAEILPYIDVDADPSLEFSSGVMHQGRMLFTTQSRQEFASFVSSATSRSYTSRFYTFAGALVWDTHPMNSAQSRTAPCWEGVWTTTLARLVALTTAVSTGSPRCFALARNDAGNCLLELFAGDTSTENISCILETRATTHNNPFEEKSLITAELFLRDLRGAVSVTVKFRPDQAANWVLWQTMSVPSSDAVCSTNPTTCFAQIFDQYRPRLWLCNAPTDTDPVLFRQSRRGFSFQYRLEWSGELGIHQFRAHAQTVPEPITPTQTY